MRKTITAVFADVTGSTAHAQALDPEALRSVLEQYFAAVSAVLSRHGRTVEKFVGDAVMAVFGFRSRTRTTRCGRAGRRSMVGRSREFALLGQAFDRAAGDRTCQLVTVLGPAGIGKSRLAHEFLTAVEGKATVLRGCVSYGEGVTYGPLVQAVRQAVGLTGGEPEGEVRATTRRRSGCSNAPTLCAPTTAGPLGH